MMSVHNIKVSVKINASKKTVWSVAKEHENLSSWVDEVKNVTLRTEGNPRNGVAAVRYVEFYPWMWTSLTEEVTSYQEDDHYEYKIRAGMPGLNDHLGRISVKELSPEVTQITWDVMLDFKLLPLGIVGNIFSKNFGGTLQRGLEKLKAQIEAQ